MPSRKRRGASRKKSTEEKPKDKEEKIALEQKDDEEVVEKEEEEKEEEEVSKPQKKKAKVDTPKSTKKGAKTKSGVSSTPKRITRSAKNTKENEAEKDEEEEKEEEEEIEKPKTRSSTRRKSTQKKEIEEDDDEKNENNEVEEEKPKTRSSTRRKSAQKKAIEVEGANKDNEENEEEKEETENSRTRSSTRRKSAQKKEIEVENEKNEENDDDDDDDDDDEKDEEKPRTRSSTRRKSAQKKEEEEENDKMEEEKEKEDDDDNFIESLSRPRRKATRRTWVEDSDSDDSEDYDDNDDDEDYGNDIERVLTDPYTPRKKKRTNANKSKAKSVEEESSSDSDEEAENELNEDGKRVPKLHLLARISKGGRDTRLIKEWAEKYKISPVAAVADLINLVIESCGCPYRVTSKKLASGDVEKILESLISSSWAKKLNKKVKMKKKKGEKDGKDADDIENEGGSENNEVQDGLEENEDSDEVVNCAILNNKKTREHFLSFWDKIIQISKDGFLYDDYLLPVLVSWVNSLTNSTTRSFRRIATSVALQITHSLIKIIQELNAVLEKNSRQQESEKKRNNGRLTSKLRGLEEQADEIRRNTEIIADTVETVFTYVIGIRYRDIVPSIRAECVAKVADFIVLWPEKLLNNKYLKYLAWALSDKTAAVRLEAVRAMAAVYRGNTESKALNNLWDRFGKRIKEMVCDVDVQVAVEVINLFKLLAPRYFTNEELEELFKFISSDIPEVRRALGSFVVATAFSQPKNKESDESDASSSMSLGRSESGLDEMDESNDSNEDDEEQKILKVIDIVQKYSSLPNMPCYVADALWDNNDGSSDKKVLQCWKTMTSMLLGNSESSSSSSTQDDVISTDPLDQTEQKTLAGILSTSCKLAAGIPITQCIRSSVPGGKEGEQLRVQQDEMTADIASELPLLLEKYGTEVNIVEDLLEIIPALSLPAISALRLERAFTNILSQVCKIFSQSVEESVLQAAAAGLSYMISGTEGPHKQSPEAETAVASLVESIISSSAEEENDSDDSDNEFMMKRILFLYQLIDFHENKLLQEKIIPKAKRILDVQSPDKSSYFVIAMKLLHQDVTWKFSCVNIESVDDIQDLMDTIEDICAERDVLVTNLSAIIVQKNNENEIKDSAFGIISEVASMFTPNLANTLCRKFAYTLPDEIQLVVREYFLENVYNEMHKKSCDYESPDEKDDSEMEVEKENENVIAAAATTSYEYFTNRIVDIAFAYAKMCCSGALGSAYSADVISLYRLYRESDSDQKKGKKDVTKKKAPTKKSRKNVTDEDDENDENDDDDIDILADEEEARKECLANCQQELDDIAKGTLRKIREHDKSKEWEAVALALQKCYGEFIAGEKDAKNVNSKCRRHFNDVSKWLSFSYGPVPSGELRVSLLRAVQETVLWALDKDVEKRVGILAPLGMAYFASKFAASEATFIKNQIEKKTAENADVLEMDGLKLFMKVLDKALKKAAPKEDVRKNLEKEMENDN